MEIITPAFGILFWQTITFLIVLWILSKFAWRPILGMIKGRERTIALAIDQIAEGRASMEQVLRERERASKEIKLERERIINEALKIKQQIIEHAHQESLALREHLLAQAKIEISLEEERAFKAIKENMGLLALHLAEKLLLKELSHDSSQLEFIDRLIANEGGLPL